MEDVISQINPANNDLFAGLTLLHPGGLKTLRTTSKNYISLTEHPIDPRPPCKFLFIRWQPGEKNQSALSVQV